MNILALDCAIKTGWAARINGEIRSGVENMRVKSNESAGMKYLRFDSWLADMSGLVLPNVIVYEKPHHLQGAAIESMNGFITGIHRFAAKSNVEYMAVEPTKIKKFARAGYVVSDYYAVLTRLSETLTPSGFAAAKGKIPTLAYFLHEVGRMAVDDNEADAYAILRYTMNELGER